VLVAAAAIVGLWLFSREVHRSALPAGAIDAGVAGVLGGLFGARLLWVGEHVGTERLLDLLNSRGGMSWFGGFAGGVLAGVAVMRWQRVPILPTFAAATPALVIGHAIGRVGCFLVGDDYGRPTDLPWAVAFPDGAPPTTATVHPTQLYEAFALMPVAWLLFHWRWRRRDDARVAGTYLVATGFVRFGIEFLRVDTRVVGLLSVAHLASLGAVASGVILLVLPSLRASFGWRT
jgi:phosphatidylglycerol---prolipoprotein diacylglyceryl transferase